MVEVDAEVAVVVALVAKGVLNLGRSSTYVEKVDVSPSLPTGFEPKTCYTPANVLTTPLHVQSGAGSSQKTT